MCPFGYGGVVVSGQHNARTEETGLYAFEETRPTISSTLTIECDNRFFLLISRHLPAVGHRKARQSSKPSLTPGTWTRSTPRKPDRYTTSHDVGQPILIFRAWFVLLMRFQQGGGFDNAYCSLDTIGRNWRGSRKSLRRRLLLLRWQIL